MFNRQTQGKVLRIITSLLLVAILLILFFLGAKAFSFLTIVEQVYIITSIFFLFIFAKSIAGYSFVLNILSTRENLEKTKKKLKGNKNEAKMLAILEEKGILAMLELFISGLNGVTSMLYDMVLIFLLGLFIIATATIVNVYVLYGAALGATTIVLITCFFDLYTNFKLTEAILKEVEADNKK